MVAYGPLKRQRCLGAGRLSHRPVSPDDRGSAVCIGMTYLAEPFQQVAEPAAPTRRTRVWPILMVGPFAGAALGVAARAVDAADQRQPGVQLERNDLHRRRIHAVRLRPVDRDRDPPTRSATVDVDHRPCSWGDHDDAVVRRRWKRDAAHGGWRWFGMDPHELEQSGAMGMPGRGSPAGAVRDERLVGSFGWSLHALAGFIGMLAIYGTIIAAAKATFAPQLDGWRLRRWIRITILFVLSLPVLMLVAGTIFT